jgi:mannitol-1-/sugar-/sorbitol-6-phosphatase
LEQAHKLGWCCVVVTSSQSALAQQWLQKTGLAPWISSIIGGEEVTKGKPDPEPYLLALAKNGCLAEESLAVEDSILGARSAILAGLPTFVRGAASHGDDWPDGVTFIDHLDRLVEQL